MSQVSQTRKPQFWVEPLNAGGLEAEVRLQTRALQLMFQLASTWLLPGKHSSEHSPAGLSPAFILHPDKVLIMEQGRKQQEGCKDDEAINQKLKLVYFYAPKVQRKYREDAWSREWATYLSLPELLVVW